MTRDDIIRMAQEAKAWDLIDHDGIAALERFAALVAQHEREACAKVAENGLIGHTIAKAIRARGESKMTDEELLELAAKAAGMEHCDSQWSEYDEDFVPWNPLDDDGDALRLAVKLQMSIVIDGTSSWVAIVIKRFQTVRSEQVQDNDPLATTRRAIVRAAAEIGRSMT